MKHFSVRFLLLISVMILGSCNFKTKQKQEATQKPNIVFIYVDDLGYADVGAYGAVGVSTPNVDDLVINGLKFTDAHCSAATCTPSRFSLLTGTYAFRNKAAILPGDAPLLIRPGTPTLASMLKSEGYATAVVGKWHLGVQEKFHPNNRGFETFYGILTATTDYIDPTSDKAKYWVPVYEGYHFPDPYKDSPWLGRGDQAVMRDKVVIEEHDYLTEAFTREAVNFIDRNSDKPFFLYLPYLAAHGPLQVTEKYYDRFPHIKDEASRIQAAMISALDDGIGQVNDALKRNGI